MGARAWQERELQTLSAWYPKRGAAYTAKELGRSKNAVVCMASRLHLHSPMIGKGVKPNDWTRAEIALLKRHYPEHGSAICKYLPKRTIVAIQEKARLLKIRVRYNYVSGAWNESETHQLEKSLSQGGYLDAAKELPGRTLTAIQAKANTLGLHPAVSLVGKNGVPPWTSDELATIYRLYPSGGAKAVAEMLPNRTKRAIHQMAFTHREEWARSEIEADKLKRMVRGAISRPTSLEQAFQSISSKHGWPFTYVGNGQFWIGRMNPDFICQEKRLCVEVANTFHHESNYATTRVESLAKHGWRCIVFLQNRLEEKDVVSKVEEALA